MSWLSAHLRCIISLIICFCPLYVVRIEILLAGYPIRRMYMNKATQYSASAKFCTNIFRNWTPVDHQPQNWFGSSARTINYLVEEGPRFRFTSAFEIVDVYQLVVESKAGIGTLILCHTLHVIQISQFFIPPVIQVADTTDGITSLYKLYKDGTGLGM